LSVSLSKGHLQSICSDFPKLEEGPEGTRDLVSLERALRRNVLLNGYAENAK
jgi:hypothetical protein